MRQPRLLRITTVPISLKLLLRGQPQFFASQGFTVLTVSADGKEVAELKSENISHEIVPMTRQITPWQDLKCVWRLVQIMRDFKPDIVHTHTPKAGLLGMLAAWLCRIPVRMHTVAGLPVMESRGVKKLLLKATERLTYTWANHVYPNSSGLLTYMQRELGARDQSKFQIIGKGSTNGIDTESFKQTPTLQAKAQEIRMRYNIHADELVFSFVGRIVRDKGIHEFVQAFKNLQQQYADKRFRMLLVGPFEQELDPLDQETYHFLQTNSQVILAGFQNDIRPWLLASDVFVFPSYREGFPNVVMQAACLEVCCIVSDINGCNEIIEHETRGLIVPPKSVDSLQHAMNRMLLQPELRKQLAAAARAYVCRYYDQQYIWQCLLKEYHDSLVLVASN